MDITNILDNLSRESSVIDLSIYTLLKLPIILLLFANILFAVLLLLRVRILAETFDVKENSTVRAFVLFYLFTSIFGGILALLFMLIA